MGWIKNNVVLTCTLAIAGAFLIAAMFPFIVGWAIGRPIALYKLEDWSNFGQWFGFVAAIAAALAFIVAFWTLQLQQQQIKEQQQQIKKAEEDAAKMMKQMIAQTKELVAQTRELVAHTAALKQAAEMNGLAAIIHYSDRFTFKNADGEKEELHRRRAAKAKDRLVDKLDLKLD